MLLVSLSLFTSSIGLALLKLFKLIFHTTSEITRRSIFLLHSLLRSINWLFYNFNFLRVIFRLFDTTNLAKIFGKASHTCLRVGCLLLVEFLFNGCDYLALFLYFKLLQVRACHEWVLIFTFAFFEVVFSFHTFPGCSFFDLSSLIGKFKFVYILGLRSNFLSLSTFSFSITDILLLNSFLFIIVIVIIISIWVFLGALNIRICLLSGIFGLVLCYQLTHFNFLAGRSFWLFNFLSQGVNSCGGRL